MPVCLVNKKLEIVLDHIQNKGSFPVRVLSHRSEEKMGCNSYERFISSKGSRTMSSQKLFRCSLIDRHHTQKQLFK